MYEVNFSIGEITSLNSAVNNTENEINSKRYDGESAAENVINMLQSAISTGKDSVSKMNSDLSRIAFVQATNSKTIDKLNNELGRLRNSNTEGCNNSQISQVQTQLNNVQSACRSLSNISSQLNSLRSATESKILKMENTRSDIKNALDKFKSFFNSEFTKFKTIKEKCEKAKKYGLEAKDALSFGCSNTDSHLTISNIDALLRNSDYTENVNKNMTVSNQNLLKSAFAYSETMQDDIMRSSTQITNQLNKEVETFCKELTTVARKLKQAYSSLKSYKSCGM